MGAPCPVVIVSTKVVRPCTTHANQCAKPSENASRLFVDAAQERVSCGPGDTEIVAKTWFPHSRRITSSSHGSRFGAASWTCTIAAPVSDEGT